MNKIELLKQAENNLFEQITNLRNRSNESLESGAQYCFVLCNAKINFINSLINDVRFAMSGHAPDMVIDSVIEAVKHVEENFKPFLGTPCETSVCVRELTDFEKTMAFLEDKPRLGDTVSFTTTDDTGNTFSANGIITNVEIKNMDKGIVLYKIQQSDYPKWDHYVYINNPSWYIDTVQVIERAEDKFGM
ncbi:hypothetical protein GAP32_391 [Cronobacter phage vB_CsaM_GAP32]|uniref:Uncharacterized protein n=1 Tax=Cronobacter phage vB_CsaM_GAP32 TaxID=1141136 RepID=K4F738_9CAUD|nr:hypothetical protein GAP32_391 [Cronobacter phage vB_CsaM_GAP32]AFC21843.1 hypothetical protein GAP32_391 [Cronobacter phage vB_CsaM_GAP32]